jgi:hypothetical protein
LGLESSELRYLMKAETRRALRERDNPSMRVAAPLAPASRDKYHVSGRVAEAARPRGRVFGGAEPVRDAEQNPMRLGRLCGENWLWGIRRRESGDEH